MQLYLKQKKVFSGQFASNRALISQAVLCRAKTHYSFLLCIFCLCVKIISYLFYLKFCHPLLEVFFPQHPLPVNATTHLALLISQYLKNDSFSKDVALETYGFGKWKILQKMCNLSLSEVEISGK